MLINKKVFNTIGKVNKNIKKLTIKNKLLEDIEAQNILLNSIVNDLAYIVAEVNQAYVQITSIIADVKEERD
jgi:biotin synthase-related radical SAM superfamily protein